MQVAILGAGAMGSWFGGQLTLGGHAVQLLTTNAAHMDAVRRHGLEMRVDDPEGFSAPIITRVAMDICRPEEFDGEAQLIIVLTKSFQTRDAIAQVAARLRKDTAILSLQNGLGNVEALAAFVPTRDIWVGMSMMPVDRLAPGVIASRGQGLTRFGHCKDRQHPFAEQISTAFAQTGMDVQHDPDVFVRIWEKVAFNAGMNALSALTRGTPGTLGQLTEGRTLLREVANEVAVLAAAEGVSIELNRVDAAIEFACEHHGNHKPSMRQDLEAGRRTEVDALNGAISRSGMKHGIATPLNTALATLLRLAELGDHAM